MVYTPNYKDVAAATKGLILRQLWRFEHIMQFEDLEQEAQLQFIRHTQRDKKNGTVYESKSHFANVWKHSIQNHLVTLSNKDTRYQQTFVLESDFSDDGNATFTLELENSDNMETVMLEIDIALSEPEIQKVLKLLTEPPDQLISVLNVALNASKERCNTILCQMLGYNPAEIDLLKKVEQFLISRGYHE